MRDNNNIYLKKSHYKHLTSFESAQIQAYLSEGKSLRFIAEKMGRSVSTISREINRNSVLQQDSMLNSFEKYFAETAENLYQKRRKNCKFSKNYDLEFFDKLKKEVTIKLME